MYIYIHPRTHKKTACTKLLWRYCDYLTLRCITDHVHASVYTPIIAHAQSERALHSHTYEVSHHAHKRFESCHTHACVYLHKAHSSCSV